MKEKLLIFDYDDTLVNTEERLGFVFDILYGTKFVSFRKELFDIIPCEFKDIYSFLKEKKIENKTFNEFASLFFGLEPDKTEVFLWVKELLDKLTSQGFVFSICSSNDYIKIDTNLRRLKLRNYFNPIISRDSGYIKPDPRLFDLLFKDFKKENLNCVYIGDSKNDSLLATNSGVPFINFNDFKKISLSQKIELINNKLDEIK